MKTEQPQQAAHAYHDNRLGPYVLHERLGEGGMAVIDKVWHTGLHRFEALKLPRQKGVPAADAAFSHRLLAEARIAAGLHHPHIVTIFNVSEEDASQPYFSMEFIDGCDIGKLLKERHSLPLEDALPILRQIASALDYAHANGVVHRDVKPSNILLKDVPAPAEPPVRESPAGAPRQWHVKVVDFGISRALEDSSGTRLTKEGIFVGTPEYMAPEQAGGGVIDARTDIYSLGIVAYEMLCGRPPFTAVEGASPVSILVKQIHDAPPPLIEHLPQLPSTVNDAVLKALSKDSAQRFATCAEFVSALSAAPDHVPAAVPAAVAQTLAPAEKAGAETGQGLEAREATPAATGVTRPEWRPDHAPTALLAAADLEAATALAKPRPRAMRSRLSTLLAGLGGLVVGAWLVQTRGPRPPEQKEALSHVVAPAQTRKTVKNTVAPVAPAPHAVARTVAQRRRVQKRLFRTIPFARRATRTRALLAGQQRIARKGQSGEREVILVVTYAGQREMGRQVVSSRVVKAPRPQLELLGTRKPERAARKRSRPSVRTVARPPAWRAARPRRSSSHPAGRDLMDSLVGELLKRGGPRHGRPHGKAPWLGD